MPDFATRAAVAASGIVPADAEAKGAVGTRGGRTAGI